MQGDALDITTFPTPKWHEEDGGRYIGTGSFNVTRDPDDGWINCGTYRVMIHDKRDGRLLHLAGQARPHHARQVREARRADAGRDRRRLRSDVVPDGLVGGAARGVRVRRDRRHSRQGRSSWCTAPITGLPIPANAEIVIEGFVQPGNVKPEGPFGEWFGYYGSDVRDEPVMDIKAIHYRNDPILLGCVPQRAPDEVARYRALTRSAIVRENIVKAGVPDVVAAWAHEVGTSRLLLVVAIKQRYGGHAKQAGHVAAMCHAGAYAGRYVIVVDEDIDPSNLEEVMWAVLTRSDPATSIDFITNAWSTPLDPRIPPEQKARGDFTNSPRDHRRLQAVPLEGPVPQGQPVAAGGAQAGQGEVGVFVEVASVSTGRFGERRLL